MVRKIKGSLRHLRRATSPPFWPIKRKGYVWAVKPRPGPHTLLSSIPLGVVIRDMLGYTLTMRETRKVLAERKIMVDGRIVTDYKFPVGLMDVLYIIPEDRYLRLVPHPVKQMSFIEIDKEEASFKPVRIKRKHTVRGGHIQLTFHDGRTHLIRVKDPFKPVEVPYKTYDTVKLRIPKQEILEHIPFEIGKLAVVIDGANVGFIGKIKSINQIFKRRNALVELEDANGNVVRTILEYVFPIGDDKPVIKLFEEV